MSLCRIRCAQSLFALGILASATVIAQQPAASPVASPAVAAAAQHSDYGVPPNPDPAVAQGLSPVEPHDNPAAWWQRRHQAILDAIRAGASPDLVLIGDSILNNYDKTGPAPDEVFAPVWTEFYAPRHALNLGFSGDETQNVLWRLQHGELDGIHPRAAILLIGTNNTGHHLDWSAKQNADGVSAVIEEFHRRQPQARLILIGLLPSALSPRKTRLDAAINAELALRYARSPFVVYRDVSSLFLLPDGAVDSSLYYDPRLSHQGPGHSGGALHPDSAAQRTWAAAIEPDIDAILGPLPR